MVSEQSSAAGEDPRFTRSRRAIAHALSDLMLKTGTCPSVSALAEAAGIHRATFYNHFDSIEEVAVYVIADDFRAIQELGLGDRQVGADPSAVALAALNSMLDSLRQRRSLFLLASTWQSPSGLMGIGDLLMEQIRSFRRELGEDLPRRELGAGDRAPEAVATDAAYAVEDVYTAAGINGVLSAAVGGSLDGEPDDVARRLYAALPGWMLRPSPSRP